ncbi:MAG: hypothetical protein CME61_07790 [Halobacteriovoraceae bacterium]|nr:hypothetical protein [Halobacteriovoraceae bacterium]
MAIAGILFGIIAGLVTAAIGYFTFGLSLWVCLAIYSLVGALSALSTTVIAYLIRSTLAEWAEERETATG